jgi:hypothetical protein
VDGLPIWKKYNAQIPAVHLGDSGPAANPPIALNLLVLWMCDDKLDELDALVSRTY